MSILKMTMRAEAGSFLNSQTSGLVLYSMLIAQPKSRSSFTLKRKLMPSACDCYLSRIRTQTHLTSSCPFSFLDNSSRNDPVSPNK